MKSYPYLTGSKVHDEDLDSVEAWLADCNALLTYKEGYLKIAPDESK